MSKALDSIMTWLDPRVMAERIDIPHDHALFSYPCERTVPSSFREFQSMLQDYYQHQCTEAISPTYALPEELSFGLAIEAVEGAFGNRGGLEGAYDIARIGDNEGIYASFRAIANFLRESHRKMYMRYHIDKHINPLDFEEKVAVIRSLQKRFPVYGGAYVPKRPEELASNHYALIVDLVQRLRSYIPTYYRAK